jgi:hypothetical protein
MPAGAAMPGTCVAANAQLFATVGGASIGVAGRVDQLMKPSSRDKAGIRQSAFPLAKDLPGKILRAKWPIGTYQALRAGSETLSR